MNPTTTPPQDEPTANSVATEPVAAELIAAELIAAEPVAAEPVAAEPVVSNDDNSDSDSDSDTSDIDEEDQRQIDIERFYEQVMENPKTRHYTSISDSGGMHVSPDGITVYLYEDGTKSIKFSNPDYAGIPQWYLAEHNEKTMKAIKRLERSIETTKANLEKENTPNATNEARLLKSVKNSEKKLQQPGLSDSRKAHYKKQIDRIVNDKLLSARGVNEARKTIHRKRLARLEGLLETKRALLW